MMPMRVFFGANVKNELVKVGASVIIYLEMISAIVKVLL